MIIFEKHETKQDSMTPQSLRAMFFPFPWLHDSILIAVQRISLHLTNHPTACDFSADNVLSLSLTILGYLDSDKNVLQIRVFV